jgi:hypothetical protein
MIRSVAVTAKLVTIFVFSANFDPTTKARLVIPIFVSITGPSVDLVIIAMPVSVHGAVIPILIRASLSIHVHGAAASFAGCPIRIDSGVFGASLILLARLV